ncbi:sigma-70 RNA polymerase sigma factor region 4 domain-containing protein [Streptomyces halobius]|uniref:Sigma-70 family RNA polymerase sigma factor n=1 Tax=Streptomyces halobius TaxID=2879846 RepID=A0ABY4M7Z9_9ACTN|nr:sigma-70 family RNA polymerase sigma factor [Streptomyces halobius]UQA93904.1 sigma-70 family RNA polymerase sigma factor [Streptomyces halobius]
MSSRPEHPRHTTGAHRSRSGAPGRSRPRSSERPDRSDLRDLSDRSVGDGGPPGADRQAPYEPCLDGLFTYCLSVLCEHDAATVVLGETLALAERQHARRPSDPALYRPWLYALARWACLRRLAEAPQTSSAAPRSAGPDDEADTDARRQHELAALAWPEAAGTTPEQREALELSVRHRLPAHEVAAVLGAEPVATRALLAAASCEVERTRAALAVVDSGRCPDVARLAGDGQMLLGVALRRELVRHVDECAECRRTAERATAAGPWPGTAPAAQGTLPLVSAERAAVTRALEAARRSRSGRAEGVPGAVTVARGGRSGGPNGSPRYDRGGFPVGPTDRAARRRRLRSRALTTTVVATVLAAPVLAVWAAYRNAPTTGEMDAPAVTANESDSGRLDGRPYKNAGNARTSADPSFAAGAESPDVSVEVISADGTRQRPGEPGRERPGPGRLTVTAQPSGDSTVITIGASGGAPVRWTASAAAPWVQMSRTAGTLRPRESTTIVVLIDHDREPEGHWRARIGIDPGTAAVTLEGHGATDPGPSHPSPTHPKPKPPEPPKPADPKPTSGHPRPTPTHHTPSPTPTQPSATPTPTASPAPTGTGPAPRPSHTTRPAR